MQRAIESAQTRDHYIYLRLLAAATAPRPQRADRLERIKVVRAILDERLHLLERESAGEQRACSGQRSAPLRQRERGDGDYFLTADAQRPLARPSSWPCPAPALTTSGVRPRLC